MEEKNRAYLLTGGQTRASKDGDWSETYICNLFDWHLKEQETMDYLPHRDSDVCSHDRPQQAMVCPTP